MMSTKATQAQHRYGVSAITTAAALPEGMTLEEQLKAVMAVQTGLGLTLVNTPSRLEAAKAAGKERAQETVLRAQEAAYRAERAAVDAKRRQQLRQERTAERLAQIAARAELVDAYRRVEGVAQEAYTTVYRKYADNLVSLASLTEDLAVDPHRVLTEAADTCALHGASDWILAGVLDHLHDDIQAGKPGVESIEQLVKALDEQVQQFARSAMRNGGGFNCGPADTQVRAEIGRELSYFVQYAKRDAAKAAAQPA